MKELIMAVELSKEASKKIEGEKLAQHIKSLRSDAKLTLQQLSTLCGLAPSTISKIENNAISPTYGNLIRLAKGFNMNIAQLLAFESETRAVGRWSLTRKGEGHVYSTKTHDYEMLCTNISNRKMVPMVARIRGRSLKEISGLNSHEGEEVMFVISGAVVMHTEFYEPLTLESGDCVYLDSTMGHVALAAGDEDATVFWVVSDGEGLSMLETANEKT